MTLGSAGGTQRSRGVRFTNNTIRADPSSALKAQEGDCIFVYAADQTTIAHNTVIGAQGCVTIAAQKVTDFTVDHNHLESYANVQNSAGKFAPRAVIDISERVVNRGDGETCGQAPKPPCPYFIHYPDQTTVKNNNVVQHIQYSPAIRVSNGDVLGITDNIVVHTQKIASAGTVDSATRATGIDVPFGVRDLPSYGYYENERTLFKGWSITGNQLSQFADGIKIKPIKAGLGVSSTTLTGNVFNTKLSEPRGIYLEGVVSAPESGFIKYLVVDQNLFGCGFPSSRLMPFPPHAYVRPSGQVHSGNIGVTIPCQ